MLTDSIDIYTDLTSQDLIQRHRRIKRVLSANEGLSSLRIAVLGGTTSAEFVAFAEIFLLQRGIQPVFWQCEYRQHYEAAVLDSEALVRFKPDLVYVLTHSVNILHAPQVGADEAGLQQGLDAQMDQLRQIWSAIEAKLGCQVIQNNFDPFPSASLGNLDAIAPGGRQRMVNELNVALVREANQKSNLTLLDVHGLASRLGWTQWFDRKRWFAYKIWTSPEASIELAKAFCAQVLALSGQAKKCLVLDLDNTLWGGVIGDDGVHGISLGQESAVGEAHIAFQQYCLDLKRRGIVLAVSSKNDEANALQGLEHPDSVLKREDFAVFFANWNPKHENIRAIAKALNLGLDSLVFADDNPVERDLVRSQLPMVAVPELGDDVTRFIEVLESNRYFESVGLSAEDAKRATLYTENAQRAQAETGFASYGDFLQSLDMKAEISPMSDRYLERIVQLVNKTNQFNVTTKRYTVAQMLGIHADPDSLCLYGRLVDKFGDNGLISVVIGQRQAEVFDIALWVMSCRVLKREMELAMLDELVAHARRMGASALQGSYIPSPKNAMVESLFRDLGFRRLDDTSTENTVQWRLELDQYVRKNTHILVSAP
jgi:FkbH-like protein